MVRDANLSLSDIKSAFYSKNNGDSRDKNKIDPSKKADLTTITIPDLSRSVISPPPPTIGGEKIISFYVNDSTDLKDVLIELGRVAEVDIDIDPKVSGKVIINAKNRPFKEILDRIATQAKLRYSYKNRVLYFEPNYPYIKNYYIDFLGNSKLWDELKDGIDNIFNAYATSVGSDAKDSKSAKDSNIIISKVSGIVTAFATEPEHRAIQNFIEDITRQSSTQVLIEARVFEVSLYDRFKYGIDWQKGDFDFYNGNAANASRDSSLAMSGIAIGTMIGGGTSISAFGSNISSAVGLLQGFGVARSISSPRIHAMNNTTATLKFNDKLVYFKLSQETSTVTTNGASNQVKTITSAKLEENEGTELSITPSINYDTAEITMLIEPTITRKTKEVTDPASPAGFTNIVPVMNERKLSTTVKIKNGNTIVIGGLMKNSSNNSEAGVPFFSKLPLIGWLFKNSDKNDTVVETVIFIKATLINSNSMPTKQDRSIDRMDPSSRRML